MIRKAIIFGIKGEKLTLNEKRFFSNFKPWGIILFSRNIKNLKQLKKLTQNIKKIFNDKNYPILIDQEGGRVNRLNKLIETSILTAEFFGNLYVKDKNLPAINEEMIVLTSGAGGLFKSGIPIGTIDFNENISINNDNIVNFYRDFSQLKYVKVVSFAKEKILLDLSSENDSQKLVDEIDESTQQQETLRILLEQKK